MIPEKSTVTRSGRNYHILTKPIGPICNLDCSYCFYLEKEELYPETKNFKMTLPVLEKFVRSYIESQPANATEVGFGWQGGEPTLMGIDFFKKVIEFQKLYARPGMRVSNSLQTNGTLLNDDWGKFLHDHNFLIGLSIDGPEDIHDRHRYDKAGKPSFKKVMQGLDILLKHKVEFNTLTVVQDDNAPHAVKIYDFLKKIGSTYLQFIPIVEHSSVSTGGKNVFGAAIDEPELNIDEGVEVGSRSVRPKAWGRFLCDIFDRWLEQKDIGNIFIQFFDTMLGIQVGYPSNLCVHSKTCGRSLAMEHNGDVYSCDHYVSPGYHQGNVTQTSITDCVDSGSQDKFGNDKYDTLPKYCLECDYLKYCYGACPKDRVLKTPDGEKGLHFLCQGYKMFYAHSTPIFEKMAKCLRQNRPAEDYLVIDQERPDLTAGRNDPCPCGSGKKFKKCCGA